MAKNTEEQPSPGQNDNVRQMADLFRKLTALSARLQPPAEPCPPAVDRGALVRRLKDIHLAADALPAGSKQVLCAIIDEQIKDLQPSTEAVKAPAFVPPQLSAADKDGLARDLRSLAKLLAGLAKSPRPSQHSDDDLAPMPGVRRKAMQQAGWLIVRAVREGLVGEAIDPNTLPADARAMMHNYPSIKQQILPSGKHASTELGWDWGLVAHMVPLKVFDVLSDKYPEKLSSQLAVDKHRYPSQMGYWLNAQHSYRNAAWVCRILANLISPRRPKAQRRAGNDSPTPLRGMVTREQILAYYNNLDKHLKDALRNRLNTFEKHHPEQVKTMEAQYTDNDNKTRFADITKYPATLVDDFVQDILRNRDKHHTRTQSPNR